MSDISDSFSERRMLDYALIGIAGLAVLGFLCVGFYGTMTGFLQTVGYYKANDVVGVISAAISAGCGLYLTMELGNRPRGRTVLVVCALCAMFGFFTVSKGIPAVVTAGVGKPGVVTFTVDRFEGGGKNCPRTVVAVNAGYEDLRQCITAFDGHRIDVGDEVEVSGMMSNWGIARERMRVVR